MSLKDQIRELGVLRAQLAAEVELDDNALTAFLAEGRAKSEVLNAKKERLQHFDQAISNIRILIEMEKAPEQLEPMASKVDPWG